MSQLLVSRGLQGQPNQDYEKMHGPYKVTFYWNDKEKAFCFDGLRNIMPPYDYDCSSQGALEYAAYVMEVGLIQLALETATDAE